MLCLHGSTVISIHALREEGDHPKAVDLHAVHPISIHALREEGDPRSADICSATGQFLSTPSARRATLLQPEKILFLGISSHALREEGDLPSDTSPMRLRNFYPRPPRGGRPSPARSIPSTSLFLSTPSARRATREVAKAVYDDGISIHALREEGDEYHDSG